MGDKDIGNIKEKLKKLVEIEEDVLEKIFELAAEHGLKIDLEFQDQEISLGGHNITLSGKTIIKGEEREG